MDLGKKTHEAGQNISTLWYNNFMKRVRITYSGAYHHRMNRRYDGNKILVGDEYKSQFLEYPEDSAQKIKSNKIRRLYDEDCNQAGL